MSTVADIGSMQVRHIMSDRVVAMRGSFTVMQAMDTVLGTGLRHIVVVDGYRRCLGVVSAEAMAVELMSRTSPSRRTLNELLPRKIVNVFADVNVRDASATMLGQLTDALAVVDEGDRPIGILTWSDIVRLVAGSSTQIRRPLPRAVP